MTVNEKPTLELSAPTDPAKRVEEYRKTHLNPHNQDIDAILGGRNKIAQIDLLELVEALLCHGQVNLSAESVNVSGAPEREAMTDAYRTVLEKIDLMQKLLWGYRIANESDKRYSG